MTRRRAAPNAHSGLFKKGCVPHNKGANRPANQYITGDVKPVYMRLDQDVQEMVDSTGVTKSRLLEIHYCNL